MWSVHVLVLCRSVLESWVKCGRPWLRLEKGSGPPSLITASCFVIALHCECSLLHVNRTSQTGHGAWGMWSTLR